MKIADTATPVVVVNCQLAALAIMRSLGRHGVPVYGVDGSHSAPAMRSRYCRGRFVQEFSEERPEPYLEALLTIGKKLGRAILIATSDETTQFVADHADALRRYFRFQENSPSLVRQLASKREMFELALAHGVPTPSTRFPRSLEDVLEYADRSPFPVMLKGIYGNRLQLRTQKKMAIVHTREELVDAYRTMEDPDCPNLMLQEYIPGGDDQVYIFNGYFDDRSDCLAGFTGYKIRQFPVHVGCASLGECRWIEEVAITTTRFMKAVGYRGILDIGYRLDPRDGRYKVLDINPRVGQAFRLFVARNDHDVAKALYLDFTGQRQPPVEPREGRRWLIEDYDLISSYHYHREGTLRAGEWLRSFKGVEEAAWFDWRDLAPFLGMARALGVRVFGWALKRASRGSAPEVTSRRRGWKERAKKALRSLVPLAARKALARAVHRQAWIHPRRRQWWAVELVRDLSERDVNVYHQFLWTNHLGYAASYEPEQRFGAENLRGSRRLFFADLRAHLAGQGIAPERDIRAVLEVGCSLGYQLRYMETELFPAAALEGIDIDQYAIRSGSEHLRQIGSKVALRCADMSDLDRVLGDRHYDLIVCTGVLMYLAEHRAAQVVSAMLRHARIVALAGLAHQTTDNALLRASDVRSSDTTFVHNLDRMVEQAGGRILGRDWQGSRQIDGNTIYFVFASAPARVAYAGQFAPSPQVADLRVS